MRTGQVVAELVGRDGLKRDTLQRFRNSSEVYLKAHLYRLHA